MTDQRAQHYLGLLRDLVGVPHECEWMEFNANNLAPEQIGEHVGRSATSDAG